MTYLCLLIVMVAPLRLAQAQQPFRPPTPLGLDEYYPVPENNPLTREKIDLGQRLFIDKLLSADRTISCASCHRPELAFSGGIQVSPGVGGRKGIRNAPALVNRAYGKSFFWDGRVQTLEQQILLPIQNAVEMNLPLDELTRRLEADVSYIAQFERVFSDSISSANLARALASFVRTLRFGNSPYDRFYHGDRGALSEEARRGLELFRGKANCVRCHSGPNFTDEEFHNTGVSWGSSDLGRHAVTGHEKDIGAFRTPTLREVERTAPYMHDGSIARLQDVIDFYDKGGNKNPNLDRQIRRLNLTADEKRAIVEFLKSLSGNTEGPRGHEVVRERVGHGASAQ